ncbi:MAG: phage protein [Sulfolobaceae archaeon]
MSGFADGTFLELTSDVEQFTKITGADGFVTRVKSNDYGATLTITLAQTSPSNDVLSGIFNLDKLSNQGIVPILIKDMSGNTVIFSATGWIQSFPDMSFGNEINDRSWIFDLANIDMFIGGNSVFV